MVYILVFVALFIMTIINAIVPLPGSSVVTPLLTLFMSPKNAIAFATIYFMLSSLILVYAYRKYLRTHYIKSLLPVSLIGAFVGAVFYLQINEIVALVIVLIFVIYFTYKKAMHIHSGKQPKNTLPKSFIGIVSGLFQGSGFAGGDMRNGYLYSEGLNAQQVRATTAAIGASNFFVATLIRGFNGQLDWNILWLFIPIFPMLVGGIYLGRHVTLRLNEKWQNRIILSVMFTAVAIITWELVEAI